MNKTVCRFRNFIISFGIILWAIPASQAQSTSSIYAIDSAIERYANARIPERVYFHFDKSGYTAGETVWFKAYLMNELIAANDSKTFYIDWIDDKGNLLQHSISPLVEAVTAGQFDIPATYKGRFIHVKAYTRWMLNFDSAFLYNEDIRIFTKEQISEANNNMPPVINFFPEGGDMIADFSNKIAFKANDQWGRPVKVKGIIVNSNGKVEDSIRVMHDGMGYFYLKPAYGVTYSAKWKDEKGANYTTVLPAVKKNGAVMQITTLGENKVVNINYSSDIASAPDSLYLIGTMYQHEVFKLVKPSGTGSLKANIPAKNLPSGILTITLFDKNWNALSERIVYINNQEFLFNTEMEVEHYGLNKRARNTIKIKVPDGLPASLSIAVTDAAIGADSSKNIISELMLSSELKGKIYNPSYYFSNTDAVVAGHLDLVMLTHGWRRFKWEEVSKNEIFRPQFSRDTSYISLSGKVLGLQPGEIGNDAMIILIVKEKEKAGGMVMLPVERNGTFNNGSNLFFDTAQIYYQFQRSHNAKKTKDVAVQFMIDKILPPALRGNTVNNFFNFWRDTTGSNRQVTFSNEANMLAERTRSKVLENVTVVAKTKSPKQVLEEKYTSGLFTGGNSIDFDLVNDPFAPSALDIFAYLQGKVAGLQISQNGGETTMRWRDGTPQVYLDEMSTDVSMIQGINVNDIAYVKVFRPPFMGGAGGGSGGAIAIYTRKGNDVKSTPGKGLNKNSVTGYTLIRQFYSPNYSSFNESDKQKDIRTTLYWNPLVVTAPGKKEVSLSFYNNDISTGFRVVIEGMTSDGRLTHLEQVIE